MFRQLLITLPAALAVSAGVEAQTQKPAVGVRLPLPGASAGVIAFVNVAVVPMDAERVLPNHTVLVEGGWITALGPSAKVSVPAAATRIEGRGKYLIPGLADMHVHMGPIITRRVDSAVAAAYLHRWLSAGVTTVRNMTYGFDVTPLLQIRAMVAEGKLLGPRIYAASSWHPKRFQLLDLQRQMDLGEIASLIVAYQAAGYDFIKPYYENRTIFDSVAAAARRVGIPLAGHVPPEVPIDRAFVSGMRAIEHLTGYINSSETVNDTVALASKFGGAWRFSDRSRIRALAAATARAGIWNTPTRAVYHTLVGPNWSPEINAFADTVLRALNDAGAGLLLGSDLGGVVTPEIELKAMVRAGLTPYEALLAGTRNVAAYFETLAETGTVAVGKRADLVLLSGNPLHDVRYVREPVGVTVGGRWLNREMLDHGWLSRPTARGALLDDWIYIELAESRISFDERTALERMKPVHEAQRAALTDSLAAESWMRPGTERRRMLRLIAEQLRTVRAALPPNHQEYIFDPLARVWMREHARSGIRVGIPGVEPSLE